MTAPEKRSWLIDPMGDPKTPIPLWLPFASIIPALLLYLLLFIETHICQLLMIEKTNNKKGAGLHLDIVILCGVNLLGSFFGGPWICAATVRAVAHISALTVMSTTHAPGELPQIVEVKDQRLSGFFVNALIGLSILLAPLLRKIPYSVLFGVIFYMGFSSIGGTQLFERMVLLLLHSKYHPHNMSYVKKV